jgi:hypothetical protein
MAKIISFNEWSDKIVYEHNRLFGQETKLKRYYYALELISLKEISEWTISDWYMMENYYFPADNDWFELFFGE